MDIGSETLPPHQGGAGVPPAHGSQGGAGVPPAHVSEEARQKLEQSVIRQRQKLTQIADLALAAEAKSSNANARLGSKYLDNSKAIAEIRRICKLSMVDEIAPDYEWLARIMTSEHFEPECLAKAIEEDASKRQIEYPTFYTPGWLVEIAKYLAGNKGGYGVPPSQRKHTMDFGSFHVVRFAIRGLTMLSFRRKQEKLECGSLVEGRIIVATISKRDVGREKLVNCFTVKSYEPGESARVLYAGDSWVSMSKTEKMVYKMVKTDIKETQRRHITRKRKRNAAKQGGEGVPPSQQEVK